MEKKKSDEKNTAGNRALREEKRTVRTERKQGDSRKAEQGLLQKAEALREEKPVRETESVRTEKNARHKKSRSQGNVPNQKKSTSLFARVVLRIVSIIVAFALGCGVFYFASRRFTDFFATEKETKSALVDRQLSYCQELVTAKYRYSDIVTLKKSAGFAKSYSIVKYTGLIRVGIADFTDVSYYLSADEKTVFIKMPACEVLGNEIVSQEVFDEKQSIFVPITTQEIFEEIDMARVNAVEDMIAEGILTESADYAKRIIRQFMIACGFEDVVFR